MSRDQLFDKQLHADSILVHISIELGLGDVEPNIFEKDVHRFSNFMYSSLRIKHDSL